MNTEISFIIIDDRELDRFLTQKFLELTYKDVLIKSFQEAQHALDIIRKTPEGSSSTPTIILLDLQMPEMNGFQFVEEFEKLPAEIQEKYKIIILTILLPKSDPNEIYRILTYGTVKSIIQKPLTREKLISLFMELKSDD
jgi:DNA-binding NarL/FixJ family response regulator